MKKQILGFVKDFFIMLAIILFVEFIFYKINFISEISIFYIVGFMIGWSIWQIVKIVIENKKQKQNNE